MWKSVRKGEKDRVSEHKKRLGEAAQSIWCDCPHLHLDQFRDARHCHINFRNFIPGTVVNDAGDRQTEDTLEDLDSLSCGRSVDSVRCNCRNRRIGS